MKKSLLALAAMGAFAGAAQAQSSVSVYGIMDGSYSSIEQNATDTTGAKTTVKSRNTVNGDGALSTSRLGFRGVEDLGGGLSAQSLQVLPHVIPTLVFPAKTWVHFALVAKNHLVMARFRQTWLVAPTMS